MHEGDTSKLFLLTQAVAALEEDDLNDLLEGLISVATPPLEIINALSRGMEKVGAMYDGGIYFLSELIFSGEIFKEAMGRIKPLLEDEGCGESMGKVLMGTVRGDIHDLGKNIVIVLLECAGYEVIDLGVDVPPEVFVQALKDDSITLVGMSSLLTTAFEAMEQTVEAVCEAGLRDDVRIMIGGGSTSDMLKEKIGADFFGKNATAAVEFANMVYGKQR